MLYLSDLQKKTYCRIHFEKTTKKLIQMLDDKDIGEKNILRIISSKRSILFEYNHRLFCISRSLAEEVAVFEIP